MSNPIEERSPNYRIWELTDIGYPSADDPRTINYNTGLVIRLDPIYSPLVKGRLINTEWSAQDEQGNLTDLILKVDSVYEEPYNEQGHFKRITTRSYYLEDGTLGEHKKISIKDYNTPDKIKKEGTRRRANIVNSLKVMSQQLGVEADMVQMLKSLKTSEILFVEDNDQGLLADIGAYQGEWLDTTLADYRGASIRQLIIGALTI